MGGALQHGALCARENGKPAVAGIDLTLTLTFALTVTKSNPNPNTNTNLRPITKPNRE